MTSAKGDGFVPEVHQRFKEFAEMVDPRQRLAHTVQDLEQRLQRCESPIEQILLIDITRLLTERELTHFCAVDPQIWAYYTEDAYKGTDVPPRLRVVGVRLDFLVCFENDWDYIGSARTFLLPRDRRPPLLPLFAIECDGRDFHTHETAIQRDKARDRALTSLGLTTIRFTGVEIVKDSCSCAWEVFNLFLDRFREILDRGANRNEFVDYHEPLLALTMKPDLSKPPRLARFRQLYLSERAHDALLRIEDADMISDDEAQALGLLWD